MKRKLLALIFVALLVVTALASCKIKDKGNGSQDSGNNASAAEKGIIFSPDVEPRIIKSKDAGEMSVDDIFNALYNSAGQLCEIRDDSEEKVQHEIVIGESTRPITEKAKAALDSGLARVKRDWEDRGIDTTFLIGYCVYSDGESLALVWSDEFARTYAFDYLISNYFNGEILMLEDGYVSVQGIDRIELLQKEEDAAREELYAEIAEEYSWDVANALKTHLGMFDERYYQWLADLYNPGEYDENGNPLGGGFYYSNSGRDTEGYLIDLESTMQAMSWITGASGLFSGQAQARETLPASMIDEMAAFALSCQSSTDGYFYHPQWGTGVSTSRIGRDLSWATQILSYCQVKPYWNTPNNNKGFYGEPNGDDSVKSLTVKEYREILANAPATALSEKLSSSSVSAVSKVLSTAGTRKWNGSSWLATMDAWEAYLQGYDATIHTSSYSIGNNFSAQSGQINTRDKLAIENGEYPDVRDVYGNPKSDGIADGGYVETWKRYFDDWQFENGLWEECSLEDGTVYYNAINGLMKISSCYDSLKMPFPRPVEAFNCAVFMVTYFGSGEVTGNDAEDWKDSKGKAPTGSVDVYNPWVAMSHILAIVGRTDKTLQAELRKITQDNALAMIKATTKKIAKFAKNDGSFGYTWSSSPANSQGAPVAVPNTVEGDINGGGIAFTGTFGTMRSVLGITGELKPFDYSDGLLFAKRISELSPVLKGDGSVDGSASSETGERDFNSDVAGEKPEDVTLTLKEGSAQVVEDPLDKKNKYLQFNAVPGESGNSFSFKAKTVKNPSSIVLEFKIKFDTLEHTNGTDFQIKLQPAYMLTLSVDPETGTFKIGDAANTGSPNISQWFDGSYDAYAWNTVRVEYYLLDADEKITATQIYVNGELRAVSDNYWLKASDATPQTSCTSVSFFTLKGTNLTAYFDDLYFAQSTTPYVQKPIYDPDLVKNFDDVEAGGDMLPNGVTTTGGEVVSSPTEEKPENNIFVLDAKDETVTVASAESFATPNCYSLNTLMKIDATSVGAVGNLILTGKDAAKIIAAYRIEVYEDGGTKYAKLVEYGADGADGKSYIGLPVGEWFTLTVEFYPYFYETDACAIVYLNGTEIGRGNKYYHIGNISTQYYRFTLTLTGSATVSLDDVSPDRIYKSFTSEDGTIVEDPDIKLPLAITAKDETISVNATKDPTTPNCYSVTTSMMIDATAAGAIANLYIAGKDASLAIAAYRVEIYEQNGTKLARLVEFDKAGNTGKTISGLPVGEYFTLTIDFYPYFYESDECAIVYLEGEEIGRGNTHYYVGTLSTAYSKFIATMTADGAAIYFKNTLAMSTFKKFLDEKGNRVDDPDVELPTSGKGSSTDAAAGHDGRFDFEGFELGTPKVPGLTTSVNTNEYGYWLDIVKDPTDAANQCLSHIVVPSESYGNSQSYTASKTVVPGANCYVMEFDVLIANGVGGQVQTSFNGSIVGSDGKTKSVKLFQTNTNFRGTSDNGTVQVTSKRDVAESLISYTDANATADEKKSGGEILATTKATGWVNIRFELYTDQAKVQIYYDGEYRGETDLVYTNQMKATLTTVSIYTVYGARQELYFDNVVVEAIKKDYVAQTCADPKAPAGDGSVIPVPDDGGDDSGSGDSSGDSGTTPDTPVVPEEPVGPTYPEGFDGTYDFEDQQTGTFDMYGANGTLTGGGYAMVMEDSRTASKKCLQFNTQKGSGIEYNEYISFDIFNDWDAKKYVYEWDMKFDSSSGSDIVQLSFGASYMLVIYVDTAKGTYSIGDMSSSSSKDSWYARQNSLISYVPLNEWHSFKIEYAVVNNRAMIKLYFDGALTAVSDNHYGENMALTTSETAFTTMRFRSMQSATFTVNLDNVKLYGSTEAIEVAEYTHAVYAPDPYLEPCIIDGAVNNFDTVDNVAKDTASPIATYTVVNDPLATSTDEAVNKVLKVILDNTAQSYDANTIATHNLSEAKSVGIYEFAFDVYFGANALSTGTTPLQFVLNSSGGYAMLISAAYQSDGTFRITQDTKDGTAGLFGELGKGLKLADGKWHNLRFVFEYNGLDTIVMLYVDGVQVSKVNTYFYNTAVTHNSPVKSVTWRVKNNIVGDAYFDNMYFVYAGDLQ